MKLCLDMRAPVLFAFNLLLACANKDDKNSTERANGWKSSSGLM